MSPQKSTVETTRDPVVNVTLMEGNQILPGSFTLVIFVLVTLVGLFILLGNVLTILAILTTPQLRTQTNEFILHLAIADAIVGVSSFCWTIGCMSFNQYAYGHWQYLLVGGYILISVSAVQSLQVMTLMAVDRLLYVERPYFYARCFTERVSRRLLLSSWLLSVTLVASFELLFVKLTETAGCLFEAYFKYQAISIVTPLNILTSICITSACYIRISCLAQQQRKRIRAEVRAVGRQQHHHHHQQQQQQQQQQTRSVPVDGVEEQHPMPQRLMSTGLFVTVHCVFVACWLPFGLWCLLPARVQGWNEAGKVVLFLALCNSAVNFFIYAWKNRQFARAYKRLLRTCPRSENG